MNDHEPDDRFARGLGRLAEFEPPAAAWSGIEARLVAKPRPGRTGVLLAVALVAAAILLGVARLGVEPATEPTAEALGVPAATELSDAALDRRSEHLELLLAALPPTRVGRASTGLTTTLLEDRIAAVDERLSFPDGDSLPDATKEALKRQRVVLLDSLVRVKYASSVAGTL